MEAYHRTEDSELDPTNIQLRIFDTVVMSADVMGPHRKPDIGGGGSEVWLITEAVPSNLGVSGKTDGIPLSTVFGPTREGEGAKVGIFGGIEIMQMVEHPQRIESFHGGFGSLLPIDPPEIDTHSFIWMQEDSKISFHESGIGRIKRNGFL